MIGKNVAFYKWAYRVGIALSLCGAGAAPFADGGQSAGGDIRALPYQEVPAGVHAGASPRAQTNEGKEMTKYVGGHIGHLEKLSVEDRFAEINGTRFVIDPMKLEVFENGKPVGIGRLRLGREIRYQVRRDPGAEAATSVILINMVNQPDQNQ